MIVDYYFVIPQKPPLGLKPGVPIDKQLAHSAVVYKQIKLLLESSDIIPITPYLEYGRIHN